MPPVGKKQTAKIDPARAQLLAQWDNERATNNLSSQVESLTDRLNSIQGSLDELTAVVETLVEALKEKSNED